MHTDEARIQFRNSLWQGSVRGTGIVDADPMFVGTDDGDFSQYSDSPGHARATIDDLPKDYADVDTDGDSEEPLPLDVFGNPRRWAGQIDWGAVQSTMNQRK